MKPSHLTFLADFLAPSYLTTTTLEKLSGQFVEASEIALHNFLREDLAADLKAETKNRDSLDYADSTGFTAQDLGEDDQWSIAGPSSKHRYLTLSSSQPLTSSTNPTLSRILTTLLPSEAFRAWLSVVSSLLPTGYRTEARRFRRGLDYTLASGEDRGGDARFDVCLGATWWADVPVGSDEDDKLADEGGWDCYLASPEEGEDPAVYQSKLARQANGVESDEAGPSKPTDNGTEELSNAERANGDAPKGDEVELEIDGDQLSEGDFDSDSDSEADPDAPLLLQPVSFNKLLIVLRDPGVMRFVKFLGHGAAGSRWDVGGEYEVGAMEVDEDEGEGAEGGDLE